MGASAGGTPELTDEEWTVVLELLARERNELPIEISHTFRHAFRDELRHRLDVVSSLMERLTAWKNTPSQN